MPDFKEVRTALIERWKFMGIEWKEVPDDPLIFGEFANAEVTVQYAEYRNSKETNVDIVHLTCRNGWRTQGTIVSINARDEYRRKALLIEVRAAQAYASKWLSQLQDVDNAIHNLTLQKRKIG